MVYFMVMPIQEEETKACNQQNAQRQTLLKTAGHPFCVSQLPNSLRSAHTTTKHTYPAPLLVD